MGGLVRVGTEKEAAVGVGVEKGWVGEEVRVVMGWVGVGWGLALGVVEKEEGRGWEVGVWGEGGLHKDLVEGNTDPRDPCIGILDRYTRSVLAPSHHHTAPGSCCLGCCQ